MVHVKLSLLILFLVPVVAVPLASVEKELVTTNNKNTSVPTAKTVKEAVKATVQTTVKAATVKTTVKAMSVKATENATLNANVSVQPSSVGTNLSTTPLVYAHATQFGDMIKRLTIVGAILTAVVAIYFIVRFARSGRRKARKYGVVKTPGDVEMRPLESDYDDDDDDVTMFNRKN